jgi:hypothetical protein
MMECSFSLSNAAVGSSARIAAAFPTMARCNCDALLLAAAQLERKRLDLVCQPNHCQRVLGLSNGTVWAFATDFQCEPHVVDRGEGWKQIISVPTLIEKIQLVGVCGRNFLRCIVVKQAIDRGFLEQGETQNL